MQITGRNRARRRFGVAVAGVVCAVLLAAPLSAALLHGAAAAQNDCTIAGTAGADVLAGTSGDDVICGLGGDDVLRGEGGDDRLLGNGGDDQLLGGAGNDKLRGDGGDDVLKGGGGNDNLRGGVGADVYQGGPGSDLADYLNVDEAVTLSIGNGAADGVEGEHDDIKADVENLRGGSSNDSLQGNGGRNWLNGYEGADRVRAGAGDDRLYGAAGPDMLDARDSSTFSDQVFCGPGDGDRAFADSGDEVGAGCENVTAPVTPAQPQPQPPPASPVPPPGPPAPTGSAPTDISLSNSTVAENEPAGTAVGTLTTSDPDAGDTFSYALVAGTGSADNGSFRIDGSALETDAVLDADAKATYSIRVRTTDSTARSFEKEFAISVSNGNEPPSDIELSGSSVPENEPAGASVGTLSSVDPDAGDTHSYELVAGAGDDDNGSFTIAGTTLETSAVFDYEAKSSYSIRVRSTDDGALTFEKQLTISVGNVNEGPTDIVLSSSTVPENQAAGATVGTLSSVDPDAGDTHSYELVAGSGDADNGSFAIDGSTLQTDAVFDFEAKNSYSIRVRTTDAGSLTFEQVLAISVSNVNEDPTDIALSSTTVGENEASGTTVGTLSASDPDAADTHSFSLVSGTGSDDNGSFTIAGSSLQTSAVFDFEAKNSYSIRVRATDNGLLSFEKQFTISVSNVNEAPTDIELSNDSVAENQASGTAVGTLSAIDPESADTHSFSLVPGPGSADNGSFTIAGSSLQTNEVFDFEAKSSYSIRVQATDNGLLSFDKQLTITVTNANEQPTDIALSNSTVAENQAAGTAVGMLSTTDPDAGDTHSYELVSGTGDTDNGAFRIDGTNLQTDEVFDFEAKSSYSIRVRSSDSGSSTFEKAFTVTVTNVNEGPTDIALSDSSVAENQAAGATVGTLLANDPDAADTHSFSLVSGTGSDDNGSFTIAGTSLQTNAVFDFEAKNSYSIRVRATDNGSLTFEKAFTISVSNVNEAPTDIALSNSTLAENQPSGTLVGALSAPDPEPADTHVFTLATGTGDTDNGSFTIAGGNLRTAAVLDFETKPTYSIRVRAADNGSLSFEKVFTITVTNVNEPPTDIGLSNSGVPENEPSGTTVGTLSSIDSDAGDTHSYALVAGTGDTDNGSFTIAGSTLQTNAVFDFEAKSTYSIRVRSTDSGTLTFEKALTISVVNVNEAPVNTAPGPQTVNEDTDLSFSGLSVADVDAGTNNVQTTVSAEHGTITPASGSGATITGSGSASAQITGTLTQVNAALNGLSYRGTANWNSTRGTETLTVVTNDQGSTGTGAPLSDSDTVGITVGAVNDKPVATAKSFAVQTNMQRNLTGLLDGASDPDSGDAGYTPSFSLASVTVGSGTCSGCTISNVNANGSVDVDPAAGQTGSLTLNYTISDSGNPGPAATSDPQTITLNISGPVIWFANAASGNDTTGRGTLAAPFATLGKVDTVDAASQSIFLHSGSYANGITLNTNERLIGQGVSGPASFDALFGITPPTGTIARPAIATGTATVQGTVTLASQALLRGLALSTGTATALTGSGGLSGIDVSQTSVTTTTGTGVNLNNAAGSYSFTSVSTNGAANGILLAAMGGSTFSATGGSIVGATARGVDIDAGSGNFTYNGTITTSGSGRSVEITNRTGGTAAFTGAITDNGTGINLSANAGATITFTGGVTASTGTNGAFSATGGGTVSVTGSANTLATTSGTALNVANTTIGASGLTFRSVASNGAASGIVLNATGANGGLTVTGNAGSCTSAATCTGGAIQNSSGPGIALTSVGGGVNLTRMSVNNGGDDGIRGTTVNGLSLANSVVLANGNAVGERGIDMFDLTGSGGLASSTVSGSSETNVRIENNTATALTAFNVTASTISSTSLVTGDDGILVLNDGAGAMNVSVTGSTFTDNKGDHFQAASDADASGSINVTFDNNTLNTTLNGAPGDSPVIIGGGITINTSGTLDINFHVGNNTIQRAFDDAINLNLDPGSQAGATFVGTITGNTIGTTGVLDSGSESSNTITFAAKGAGTATVAITNNNVRQFSNAYGIVVSANEGSPVVNATVTGNTVKEPGTFALNGIRVDAGATAGPPPDSSTLCANVTGNDATGSAKAPPSDTDIRLRQRFNTTIRLPGYTGGNSDSTAVNAFVAASNDPTGPTLAPSVSSVFNTPTGGGYVGGAACTTPGQ
jgi:hypothetical protein